MGGVNAAVEAPAARAAEPRTGAMRTETVKVRAIKIRFFMFFKSLAFAIADASDEAGLRLV